MPTLRLVPAAQSFLVSMFVGEGDITMMMIRVEGDCERPEVAVVGTW